MANTFKFGNGNWAVKDGYALAYNDENNNFKPLPFDFTRASSATTLNRQGLIETVGSGKPRIDFTDNTNGHLLLEPSRTNIAQRSEEFDNSYWLKSLTSITANQAISPDGTQTADTITKNADFGALYKSGISISSGSNYTLSIFVKKSTTNFFSLRQASGSYDVRKQFNLTTKEVSNGTGGNQTGFVSSEIKEYANDWLKISIVCTSNGTSLTIGFYSGKVGESTNNGDSFIWGAQLEAGSYATSYIPTEGSSVTRVAETCVDAGNSTVFNDSEGVLYAEIAAFDTNVGNARIGIDKASSGSSERVGIGFTTTTNQIQAFISRSSTQANILSTVSDITTFNKIAFKYKVNDFSLFINGTKVGTDTSGSVPIGLDELSFDDNDGTIFYGKCKQIIVFNEALTDTELQNLTS